MDGEKMMLVGTAEGRILSELWSSIDWGSLRLDKDAGEDGTTYTVTLAQFCQIPETMLQGAFACLTSRGAI